MAGVPLKPMRLAPLPVSFLAFLGGFSTMVVELAAVRVLAPAFGDSIPVWTNVIGVILFALAVGALLGGYLADRGRGRGTLPLLFAFAGALILSVPELAPRIASWILPDTDLPLDRALPLLVEGSLSVTLLAFAPAVLLLGALAPLLIRGGSEGDMAHVGRISGLVYASGTLGSLLGTFLTTYWLVPYLGVANTYRLAGGLLLVAAILAYLLSRSREPVAMVVSVVPILMALGLHLLETPKPQWLRPGQRILEQVDSPYQRLYVVEDTEEVQGKKRRVRMLKINEGLDSFHSVRIEGTAFTGGRYYDAFALLPMLIDEPSDSPVRALSLGCAAGSILRVLEAVLGSHLQAVGVELDPGVLALADKWFRGFDKRIPDSADIHWIGDLGARAYVNFVHRDQPPFDIICIDAYRSQFYIPAQLSTVEFFESLKGRLAAGGVLALNVGDFSSEGPVLSAVAGTLASVFPTVESFRVGGQRNFLVLAHGQAPGILSRAVRTHTRPEGLSERIWAAAGRTGACRTWTALPEDRRLEDGRSDLGRLHEGIYRSLYSFEDE